MSKCKYNNESFQENLSSLADPLVEDSLELKDSDGNNIKVTDNIKRLFLSKCINYLWNNTEFSNNNEKLEAIDLIKEFQDDWLDDTIKLDNDNISVAINDTPIDNEDAIYQNYTSSVLEKEDSYKENKQRFTKAYLTKYFGKCKRASNYCITKSNELIVNGFYLAPDYDLAGNLIGKHIIFGDIDTNYSIHNLLELLYNNIYKYLLSRFNNNPEKLKNLPTTLYTEDGIYRGSFEKLNELFGDIFNEESFDDITLNNLFDSYELFEGLEKDYSKSQIDAYNSWVILKNFDTVLTNLLGNSIYINNAYTLFASIPHSRTDLYKYSMRRAKASNMNTTWRTNEEINVKDEINNTAQLLITNVDLLGTDRKVKFNEFGYIISSLKELPFNINYSSPNVNKHLDLDEDIFTEKTRLLLKGKTIYEAITSIKESAKDYIPALFELFSNDYVYDNILNDKNLYLIDTLLKNLIKSIYEGLFNINNKTSLIYANNEAGYINTDYVHTITEVADAIYKTKYGLYFNDADNNTYFRNMYDLTINNEYRNLENTILLTNTKLINNWNDFVKKYNITSIESKGGKLESIRFKLTSGITVTVPLNKNSITYVGDIDPITNKPQTPNLDAVLPVVKDVLGIDLINNKELLDIHKILTGRNQWSQLLNIVSRVMMNKYVSNEILKDENGDPPTDISTISTKLEGLYPKEKERPKYNKLLREIYLTDDSIYPLLEKLARAEALYKGKLTAAQIKDGNGNYTPNTTLSRLLGSVLELFTLLGRKENSVVKHFNILKPGVLKGIYQAKEYKSSFSDTSVNHLLFNPGEVEEAEILYDFLNGLKHKVNSKSPVGDGVVAFLPSDNSDKSYIGRITIDLNEILVNNLGIDVGNSTNLFELIKQTNFKDTLSINKLNGVLYKLIENSLGKYYSNVENSINSLWNRVNDAFKEYVDSNGNHPFAGINIDYLKSKFDAINQFYLDNQDIYKSPLQIINNAVRLWNLNHPNNITALTEHSTFEVDKNSKLLLPNINVLWLNKVLNDDFETSQLFNYLDIEIIKDLLNDGFNIPDVPIMTVGSISIYNLNDLYKYALKTFPETVTLNTKVDDILNLIIDSPDISIQLNPQISVYNKLNYLFTLEWMNATVGGLFNHPSKVKTIKINGVDKKVNTNVFRTIPLSDLEKDKLRISGGNIVINNTNRTIALAEIFRESGYNTKEFIKRAKTAKIKIGDIIIKFGDTAINSYLNQVNAIIKADDVSRFLALTKRNVSFTALMHPFSLGSLQGISSVSNMTVITDNNTEVNTVTGDVTEVPTSDGATYVNPFLAYWENGSLSEKVGINKKLFIHYYNLTTGTGGIVKTAGFAVTNELMRLGTFDRVMMKEMTSGIWRKSDGTPITNIDITTRYDGNKISYVNYNDIKGRIYIKDSEGNFHIFIGLLYNPEEDTYTRIILDIDENYEPNSETKPDPEFSNKPINSNYILWQALGGYKCYELKPGMDELSGSEYSILKVAEIANQVGTIKDRVSPENVYSLKDIYQFMKHSDIHYNPTEGAVKHGAANKENINPYLRGEVSVDNYKPNYMLIRMNQSGILLDKEHNADLEDLSIFTLVISACSARGYTFELALNLYNTLATLALNAIAPYMDSFNLYLENPNQNKEQFIDTISKLIAKSLMTLDNESSVLQYITSNLINLAKKGELIKFKDNLPFSDNSIYSKLLSIISVTLTKGAVKIKMPGVLAVLCPSKDRIKTYNGKMLDLYSELELLKLQNLFDSIPIWHDGDFHNEESDIDLCKTYKIYPKEYPEFDTLLKSAGIKYYIKDGVINTEIESPRLRLVLKSFLQNNSNIIDKVCENVLVGRNLAPYNVYFYAEHNGIRKRFTLYDCDIVKNRFEKNKKDIDYPTDSLLLTVLNTLDPEDNNSLGLAVEINGETWTVDKSSIKIDEYECVIPKVFATNFGLDYNSKLSDILEDKNYFTRKLLKLITLPTIDNKYFSIGFTKLKGDPFYVLDRSKVLLSDNFYPIDVATEVDDKGNVNVLNSKYDIDFTFSKNQNDLDNDENLKLDEVWVYVDNRGNVHRVIVTDNLQYYIDNSLSNGIVISTEADDTVKTQVESTKNKRIKNIYESIKSIGHGDIINGYKTILASIANNEYTNIDKFIEVNSQLKYIYNIGKEIWTSFNQSLKLVAARIPAQSMLSFMAMKIVGFVDSDVNTAYVSTLQTYLQGSDYTFLFSDENVNYL